jgi:uncharacterized membrane protein
VWTVGFITGTPVGEVTQKTTPDAVTVLVPTTPNPTSGFLVVVSRSELRKLDMGVERAMRLVISLGVVSQEDKPEAPKPG